MNLQYVLREKTCIGFLLPCAKGWKAYSGDSAQPLGYFQSASDAAKAVYDSANKEAAPVVEGG